jgi:hypothetical protein
MNSYKRIDYLYMDTGPATYRWIDSSNREFILERWGNQMLQVEIRQLGRAVDDVAVLSNSADITRTPDGDYEISRHKGDGPISEVKFLDTLTDSFEEKKAEAVDTVIGGADDEHAQCERCYESTEDFRPVIVECGGSESTVNTCSNCLTELYGPNWRELAAGGADQ